jgi:hypothetical protein
MCIGQNQNEKWTIIRTEPRKPKSGIYPLSHCTKSCDSETVTTLVGTVPRVLNLLWTWNYYCCKLEIVLRLCVQMAALW